MRDVKFPSQPEQVTDKSSPGIIFWSIDDKNFYVLSLHLDGSYDVYRKIDGEWDPVITRRKSSIIHVGQDAVNQIKVVLDIESVTIFINGTKLTDFPGQSPETGGTFGVYGTRWKRKKMSGGSRISPYSIDGGATASMSR